MLAHFDILNERKTMGSLFPSDLNNTSVLAGMAAVSGWKHQPDLELDVKLREEQGQMKSFNSAKLLGTAYPQMGYDQGIRRRFHACNAEKQPVADLVNKHLFITHHAKDYR